MTVSTPETPRDNIAAPPHDSEQVPSHFRGRLRLAEVDDSLRIIWKAGGRAGCHGNRFPTSLPKDALEGSGRAWQWLLPQNAGRARPEKGAEPPRRGRSHRFLTESPPQPGPSEGALTSPLVTIITVPALSPPNSPEN